MYIYKVYPNYNAGFKHTLNKPQLKAS